MIEIIDDWYVVPDSNPVNYTVRKGTGKRWKNGKYLDKPRGYYTSLSGAIKSIRDQIIAEKLSEGRVTLGTALGTISEIDARFEEILKRVTA